MHVNERESRVRKSALGVQRRRLRGKKSNSEFDRDDEEKQRTYRYDYPIEPDPSATETGFQLRRVEPASCRPASRNKFAGRHERNNAVYEAEAACQNAAQYDELIFQALALHL